MAIRLNDSLRERTWKTAQGEHIKLKDMDINHVHNCLSLIRKRARRELDITRKSGKKIRVEIAKAEATANILSNITNSIGSDLALEVKSNLEAKYNDSITSATEEEINRELVDDIAYQALLYEVTAREKEAQVKIQEALNTPQDHFFESRGKVLVKDILERPEGMPMVIVCECDSTISRAIKTGDYLGVQNDFFRITMLHRKSVANSNNDILDLTLNSKRESEKSMILQAITKDGFFDVY